MLGKKGHKILTFKRVAAFLMSMCLLLGSSDFGLTLEAAENVSATFSEKLSEDGTSSEITMSVSAADQNTEILQIENPDGTVSGDASVTTYSVAENGTYEFSVTYQVNGEDESKETFSYIVSGIGKAEEGTAITDESGETGNATDKENIPDVAGEAGDGKDTNEAAGTETGNTGGVTAAVNGPAKAPRAVGDVEVNADNFPDANFREYIRTQLPCAEDGVISASELSSVTTIDCSTMGIGSLEGIKTFTYLNTLRCNGNSLTELDLSNMRMLKTLQCMENNISSLNLTGVQIDSGFIYDNCLTRVECSAQAFSTSRQFSGGSQKVEVVMVPSDSGWKSQNSVFNYMQNPTLSTGNVDTSGFITLSSGQKPSTCTFDAGASRYDLDCRLSGTISFVYQEEVGLPINEENFPDTVFRQYISENFDTDGNGTLSEEEISEIKVVNVQNLSEGKIKTLKGIEYFSELQGLFANENELTSLDLSSNQKLMTLICDNNALTELTLATSVDIILIGFQNNKLTHVTGEYNVTGMTGEAAGRNQKPELPVTYDSVEKVWRTADNSFGDGTTITTPGVTFVEDGNYVTFSDINIKESNFEWQGNGTLKVMGAVTFVLPDGIPITEEYFPDEYFREYLKKQDFGQDEFIDAEEISGITEIKPDDWRVTTVEGLQYFTALETLNLQGNTQIQTVDTSQNKALKYLDCGSCINLSGLDVSQNLQLEYLNCTATRVSSLNVSKNVALEELSCNGCGLEELDVSNNVNLIKLSCGSTRLRELDVSHNPKLDFLDCSRCDLENSLDLSNNILLKELHCNNNDLRTIDLSKCNSLTNLRAGFNALTYIISGDNSYKDFVYDNMFGGGGQSVELPVTYDAAEGVWRTEDNTFMPDTQFTVEGISFVAEGNYITFSEEIAETGFTWTLPANSEMKLSGTVTFKYLYDYFRNGYISVDEAQSVEDLNDVLAFELYSKLTETEIESINVTAIDNFEAFKSGELGTYNVTYSWLKDDGTPMQETREITVVHSGSVFTSNRDSYMSLPLEVEISLDRGKDLAANGVMVDWLFFLKNTAEKSEKWGYSFGSYNPLYEDISLNDLLLQENRIEGLERLTTYGDFPVVYNLVLPQGDGGISLTQIIHIQMPDEPTSLVIIPSEIELEEVKDSQTIEASQTSEVSLVPEAQGEYMRDVSVSVDPAFQITNEDQELLECVVYVNGSKYDGSGPLAVLNKKKDIVSQQFEIRALKGEEAYVGQFSGTMNFTVSYEE